MNLFVRGCLFSIFFISFNSTHAQSSDFSQQLKFAKYLEDKHLYKEAVYILLQNDTTVLSSSQKESLFYQIGWLFYQQKQLQQSAKYFLKISPQSNDYNKSRHFAAYNFAYLKDYDTASSIWAGMKLQDSILAELTSFELSGLALLQRNYLAFDSLKKKYSYIYYPFSDEEKNMEEYGMKMRSYKTKSPFLAGLYSTLLPGAGRFYAGKKKQAIGSFLQMAGLGLLTYEAYKKDGIKSGRFIAFGSIFALFYTANIWGSIVTIKVKAKEFYNYYDNKILFDMHIPLRSIFN